MNIDFPPPSKGTYNNAGSSRKLCSYLEHEDTERMEKGIYIEGFFNLNKSQVVKDIDNNKAQLLKTDAKFYAIHVSPSAKELQAMGTTEQEQSEAMRRYTREVFIPEYAKNFNRGLSAEDIKFYGKIHFDRGRSDNENNMHCHLIVSRKDQANKKKLSPLTNHKNTKKGAIKGGFDRTNLFQSVEQGFDKLFDYQRPLSETFEYCNVMKNGSIDEQLKMQGKELSHEKEKEQIGIYAYKQDYLNDDMTTVQHEVNHSLVNEPNNSISQSTNTPDLGLFSALGIISPEIHGENEDEYIKKLEERKKRWKGLGR